MGIICITPHNCLTRLPSPSTSLVSRTFTGLCRRESTLRETAALALLAMSSKKARPNPLIMPPPAKSRSHVFRRARSPPRNEHGQMICDYINCRAENATFGRLCEWNKHMDRHERPYKCAEASCKLYPGFTYSGGLLRHQREVHQREVHKTKQPLFCPFSGCKLSSGTGFTRQENLEEHMRRRHQEDSLNDHRPPARRGRGTRKNDAYWKDKIGDDEKVSPNRQSAFLCPA